MPSVHDPLPTRYGCHEAREDSELVLGNRAMPSVRELYESHLRGCRDCRRMHRVLYALYEGPHVPAPPSGVREEKDFYAVLRKMKDEIDAENLLAVARLRAECARVGVREVVVTSGSGFGGPKHMARLQPLPLLLSQQLKLKRLFPGSVYKEDIEQVQVGIKGGADLVEAIVLFLRTIVPVDDEQPAAG